MALKHAYQSPTANSGTDEISSTRWNEAHTIDNQGLTIPALVSGNPTSPAIGNATIFVKSQAMRAMPAFLGASGLDTVLQPHLAKNGFVLLKPANTGTTVSAQGAAVSVVGTATSAPYAVTNIHTRTQRVDYLVTTAATTAVAGLRLSIASFRGTEGYQMIARGAPATGVTTATHRCFIGMRGVITAPTDVEPSTLLNIIGVGYDSADVNWQVMVNDGAGAATKTDTGIAVPSADRQSMFTIIAFVPPGGAWVCVRFVDESTGNSFETGQITTNIPAATQTMAYNSYVSVGGTSSVIGFAFAGLYMETDN